jgi:hypothetical protein
MSFRHLPRQLPVGLFTAAVPPIPLRRGFQPAYPIAPLIPAKTDLHKSSRAAGSSQKQDRLA